MGVSKANWLPISSFFPNFFFFNDKETLLIYQKTFDIMAKAHFSYLWKRLQINGIHHIHRYLLNEENSILIGMSINFSKNFVASVIIQTIFWLNRPKKKHKLRFFFGYFTKPQHYISQWWVYLWKFMLSPFPNGGQ